MRKRVWLDCMISLGEMNLRRERRIPNSKGRSKGRATPTSQKGVGRWAGKEKKCIQRCLKMNKIKIMAIQLLLLHGKKD